MHLEKNTDEHVKKHQRIEGLIVSAQCNQNMKIKSSFSKLQGICFDIRLPK